MSYTNFEEIALQYHVIINEKIAKAMKKSLDLNYAKFGFAYCPCRVDRNPDTICPCLEFRQTKHCHCNLYLPKKL
jgi:ferredoxin-thioredoxin reductase catalytic subunit